MEIKEYKEELKKRAKTSHVYKKYQMVGLEIAQLLSDEKHRALYMKLAKSISNQRLMEIAKDVADRNLEKPGAYFMTILKNKNLISKNKEVKKKNAKRGK
ncbi:MAG: hypothetical protein WC705_00210 [Candidatus Paceibacterota bacterium]|jgi:hypothetical protein